MSQDESIDFAALREIEMTKADTWKTMKVKFRETMVHRLLTPHVASGWVDEGRPRRRPEVDQGTQHQAASPLGTAEPDAVCTALITKWAV